MCPLHPKGGKIKKIEEVMVSTSPFRVKMKKEKRKYEPENNNYRQWFAGKWKMHLHSSYGFERSSADQ